MVERCNEWGGRRREGEDRAKSGKQLVLYYRAVYRTNLMVNQKEKKSTIFYNVIIIVK